MSTIGQTNLFRSDKTGSDCCAIFVCVNVTIMQSLGVGNTNHRQPAIDYQHLIHVHWILLQNRLRACKRFKKISSQYDGTPKNNGDLLFIENTHPFHYFKAYGCNTAS